MTWFGLRVGQDMTLTLVMIHGCQPIQNESFDLILDGISWH
jgi:hypothetical protein